MKTVVLLAWFANFPQQSLEMYEEDCFKAVEAVRAGKDVRLESKHGVKSPIIVNAMCVEVDDGRIWVDLS